LGHSRKITRKKVRRLKSGIEDCRPIDDMKPDYSRTCTVCGASPIVSATGMCGPCTFGEADTAGGDW
jgi:CRISPR/Cas system-associated protein Cas10 (large subunit of type III CRISPR-Cas system)